MKTKLFSIYQLLNQMTNEHSLSSNQQNRGFKFFHRPLRICNSTPTTMDIYGISKCERPKTAFECNIEICSHTFPISIDHIANTVRINVRTCHNLWCIAVECMLKYSACLPIITQIVSTHTHTRTHAHIHTRHSMDETLHFWWSCEWIVVRN